MRRRTTLLGSVLVAVAVLLTLTGCAPRAVLSFGTMPTGPVTVDFQALAGKRMTYVYFTDGPDLAATKAAIAQFERETGASVDLQLIPYGQINTSLQARISANNAPEVARLTDWHPYAGQLLDFTNYFGKSYPGQFIDGTLASAIDAAGHMVAVPSDQTVHGPIINVDAFTKAGVPLPDSHTRWTWPQFVDTATRVARANGMPTALAMDVSGRRLTTVLSQFGTTPITADGQVGLDSAKAEAALGMVNDLLQTGAMSKEFWLGAGERYRGGNDMFLAGQAPVYFAGSWQVGSLQTTAPFAWAAAPDPCAAECGGMPAPKLMVAFGHSKEPTLAAAFVQWMNRTENQRTIDQSALWLPTRKDLVAAGMSYPAHESDLRVFLAQADSTPFNDYAAGAHPAATGADGALLREFDKLVAGRHSVADCVRNVRNQLPAILEAAR